MVISCCICKKKALPGNGTFFNVPKDEKRRLKWAEICQKKLFPSTRICVDHFHASHLITAGRKLLLMPNAEPIVPPPISQKEMPSANDMETDECLFLNHPCPSWTANLDPCIPKTYVNQETQTDPEIFAAESAKYVEKIRKLERENKELNFRLKMQVHNSNMALNGVNKIFTEGQIRKLEGCKKIVWKSPDISSAICLHAAGPRAYNHLYKKGFPLPHVSTLQRWSQKVDVREGLLTTSLELMRQATDLSQDEKICVLAFDEMKVAETFEYDCTNDVVRHPAKYVQVVMARGLKKSWKQPVFYDFDCRMSKQILDSIISELSKAGFPVLAIVCDMGPTNRKLWSDLGATTGKYY